jgi:hypothetical protein
MRKLLIIHIGLLLLAGCGPSLPDAPPNTGIMGQALLGPNCPVVQEGVPCPDTPYEAAEIDLLDNAGRTLTTLTVDSAGRFTVDLPPGRYALVPRPPEGVPFPTAGEQIVEVTEGRYTEVIVSYDTGIR